MTDNPVSDRWRRDMSEDDLLTLVLDVAKTYRWKVVHYRPAKTAKGWRTPLQGDKGCPDVILARNGTVLLVELKAEHRYPDADQRAWLHELGEHGYLWRPRDIPLILETLR